ncbi:MAG: ribbon-helix-helix domain-containing protein [Dongiaceae bacterium]
MQVGIEGLDLASATAMRNVRVAGRRTSVRLEQGFWQALDEIARREKTDVNALCDYAAKQRFGLGLTAALRLYTLLYFRTATTEEGHVAARHGALPRPQRL